MLKIILPAGLVPSGSLVSKIRGSKLYTLVDKITIHGVNGDKQVIKAEIGVLFLVCDGVNVNAINAITEVVWQADETEVASFIEGAD